MKGLYITNLNPREISGVSKKIDMQIKALKELGHEINLVSYFKEYKFKKVKGLTTRLPFFPLSSRWEYSSVYEEVDFLYIRYPLSDRWFVSLLRDIKQKNKNIIIILEIATFPYDGEAKTIGKKMRFMKDSIHRQKLSKYVDYVVTSSEYDIIFGIPTIKIFNGIDVDSVPLVRRRNSEDIVLGTVSSLSFWQGFDRIIEGLAMLSEEELLRVKFLIAGKGPEENFLKNLAKKYGFLEKGIIEFRGELFGDELDIFFNEIDIGVGCIGLHRKGLNYVNTLKVREYCARGLPFIIANNEGGIDDTSEFILKIAANDSPVNIAAVSNFHMKIAAKENLNVEIRNYASSNLSWKKQMEKVSNVINRN